MTSIRIFVSSPGDVAEERVLAERVIKRLATEFAPAAIIESVFWEHEPLRATQSFQTQISPPSEADIVVCILWARLGSRLPRDIRRPDGTRYASGTEYEFEDAVHSWRSSGRPDLLVYRKTADPVVSLRDRQALLDRLQQKEALDLFFNRYFQNEDGSLSAAFHPFASSADFEDLLERHLRKLALGIVPTVDAQGLRRPVSWKGASPYRGLAAFNLEHAPIFFGRTRAVEGVIGALRRNAETGRAFVLVVGMSGSGKSSLARAGVLPLLMQPGIIEGVAEWRYAIMHPADAGGSLIDALAASLIETNALPELAADQGDVQEFCGVLRERPGRASLLIGDALARRAAAAAQAEPVSTGGDAHLVLLADQMEEMFLLDRVTSDERQSFVDALSALAGSGYVWIVATLRSDFYARCEELPALVALKAQSGEFHLLPPSPAEIGRMISLPARAAGVRFEEDPETRQTLDETLRDAASRQPGSLPLLEFTLEQLYERRSADDVLTLAAYNDLGGLEGALAERAEGVFNGLPPHVQNAFAGVFRRLVHVSFGPQETFTRKYAPTEAFASPEAREFVDAFIGARLFVADRDMDARATVSLAHEALIDGWPRLRDCLKSNRELLVVRSRLGPAAGHWAELGRPVDLLLAEGKALEEALPLIAGNDFGLLSVENDFIRESSAQARRRHRARQVMNFNSVVLLVAATAITSLYMWLIVPAMIYFMTGWGETFALPVRLQMAVFRWAIDVGISLLVLGGLVLYFARKRLRVSEFLKSGLALAITAGVAMLVSMGALFGMLYQMATTTPSLFREIQRVVEPAIALKSRDYAAAVRSSRELLGIAELTRISFRGRLIPYAAVLLGESSLALGDDDQAWQSFRKAVAAAQESFYGEDRWIKSLGSQGVAAAAADIPRLGIRCVDAFAPDDEPNGAATVRHPTGTRIVSINRGGAAFRSGLQVGDVVRRMNGVDTTDRSALVEELRNRHAGSPIRLDVIRNQQPMEFTVTPGKASDMFRNGCDRGFAEDCGSLGTVYERGDGVVADLAVAVRLYTSSCAEGDSASCVSLGQLYESGRGITQDYARAAELFRRACASEDLWGCNNLGVVYERGRGVTRDDGKARELIQSTCVAGLPEACANYPPTQWITTSRPYTR